MSVNHEVTTSKVTLNWVNELPLVEILEVSHLVQIKITSEPLFWYFRGLIEILRAKKLTFWTIILNVYYPIKVFWSFQRAKNYDQENNFTKILNNPMVIDELSYFEQKPCIVCISLLK